MTIRYLTANAPPGCAPGTTLAEAAALMLKWDCGVLPVVHDGWLVGSITTGEIFVALAMRSAPAAEITVGEVACTCVGIRDRDDSARLTNAARPGRRVRRLPLEKAVMLTAIVSMHDILADHPKTDVSIDDIVCALQSIGAR